MMFKHYSDLCDVVSLFVYCPAEKSFLVSKETNGEYWIPTSKSDNKCWKATANKFFSEIFGVDAGPHCTPLRVCKVWIPEHRLQCIYHVVYKAVVKSDIKKRTKLKGVKCRLLWLTTVELERQRLHMTLRSPEIAVFAHIATGDFFKETEIMELDMGSLIEICEHNVVVGVEAAAGAVAVANPHYHLLQAAGYSEQDQLRFYREFLVLVFPALYMSPCIFTVFMMDLGWQRAQCSNLFRYLSQLMSDRILAAFHYAYLLAADAHARGGLSFVELLVWAAALEPHSQNTAATQDLRCRFIFRYFDGNRDLKLEYSEFKELVASTRAARELPVDALSVAKDADMCLRQLGLQPNSQVTLSEFLRGVSELRVRGTSSLLRANKTIIGYIVDLQEREYELASMQLSNPPMARVSSPCSLEVPPVTLRPTSAAVVVRPSSARLEYGVATYTVRLHRCAPDEMLELAHFDEDTVTASTTALLACVGRCTSAEQLGPASMPVEALAAVKYFATPIDKLPQLGNKGKNLVPQQKRTSMGSMATSMGGGKAGFAWGSPTEELALGSMLLRLADAVQPIVAKEPRLLKISSPVYVIGDLHGNLAALSAMEAALWPAGAALAPAKLLFLGDYVDRGPHGSELMAYLLAIKLQRPRGVFLIRGNHETRDIQKMFTFYNECVAKYGDAEGTRVWNAINMVFDILPLAAVVDDKVFCCHGGIPPPWVCPLVTGIDKIPSPLPKPAEQSSVAWELLWNDPIKQSKITATVAIELTANEGFANNGRRGTGHVFDQNALDRFLATNSLSHVVRAHEVHQSGFMCQMRGRLVSVFSSARYCGGNNDSGLVLLDNGKMRLMRLTNVH